MLLVHLINRVVREEERMTGRWDEGRGGGGAVVVGLGGVEETEKHFSTLVAAPNFHPH